MDQVLTASSYQLIPVHVSGHYPSSRLLSLAATDLEEFVVDDILAHSWAGNDLWFLAHVRDNKKCKLYVKTHKVKLLLRTALQKKKFDNTVLSADLKRLNVKHVFSYPHHESNGLAERRNQEIRSTLNKYTVELNERKNWSKLIPIIQLIINSIPCSSTGFSPFTVLFGTNTLPRRNVIEHIISQPASDVKLDNRTKATGYLLELETTLNELWNKANLTQSSLVESRNPTTPPLQSSRSCPKERLGQKQILETYRSFVVSEILGSNGYRIKSIVNESSYVVSQYHLIPFTPNILNDNAKRLAALDKDEFVVEDVLDHHNNEKELLFLVKFLQCPSIWQPLESLRDGYRINEKLLQYCNRCQIKLPPRKRGKVRNHTPQRGNVMSE
ncbi:hypothetical protein GEMRC1_000311 [Eukaryota sp. GEM-RC1]